jgi:hypothetical protein
MVALTGCGPVHLGEEEGYDDVLDGSAANKDGDSDDAPRVEVSLSRAGGCDTCFSLVAGGVGGRAPYTYEWEDGSRNAERTVCPGAEPQPLSVVVRDADDHRSLPHVTRLDADDASCPLPPPRPPGLCLDNPSFEGTPGINTNIAPMFEAAPWSACMIPAAATGNTPDVGSDTLAQMVAVAPKATAGATYLGLLENEQASQRLCRPLTGGSQVSFTVDLSRVYIGGGVPDTEPGFLEIHGGVANDCSQRELLWASPALATQWESFCVTLRPQQFMDNLTLRSRSDNSLGTPIYLTVDNIVPVDDCP